MVWCWQQETINGRLNQNLYGIINLASKTIINKSLIEKCLKLKQSFFWAIKKINKYLWFDFFEIENI